MHNKLKFFLRPPQNDEDKNIAFDQYKILVESINKSNEIREASNNFWTTVNALGISAIAYIRDNQSVDSYHKPLVLWGMIALGIILCVSWISYLGTIKKTIDIRNRLLLEIEKFFPFRLFTILILQIGRQKSKRSLTTKETIIPYLFIIFYVSFGIFIFLYP